VCLMLSTIGVHLLVTGGLVARTLATSNRLSNDGLSGRSVGEERSETVMLKFALPGALLCVVGVVWCLQGLVGKSSSGGMNGDPIWAVFGVVAFLGGVALLVAGKRAQARTKV
jgi:hypothetical protein